MVFYKRHNGNEPKHYQDKVRISSKSKILGYAKMTKKSFLVSAREPKVQVNFSQGLKVTMKILHEHFKLNIRTWDQKSSPKTPRHPISTPLRSPSCLCFLAIILSNAYSCISVHDQDCCSWIGTSSLSLTCGCFWYRSLAVLCLCSLNSLLRLCVKLHVVQFKAQRLCKTSLIQ